MAANNAGSIDASAAVIVRGDVIIFEGDDVIVLIIEPPKFLAKPHDSIAIRGSSITMNCHATVTPKPTVTWLFQGENIPQSPRRLVTSSGEVTWL